MIIPPETTTDHIDPSLHRRRNKMVAGSRDGGQDIPSLCNRVIEFDGTGIFRLSISADGHDLAVDCSDCKRSTRRRHRRACRPRIGLGLIHI